MHSLSLSLGFVWACGDRSGVALRQQALEVGSEPGVDSEADGGGCGTDANACGGCDVLAGVPGDACEPDGFCQGHLVCTEGAVACELPDEVVVCAAVEDQEEEDGDDDEEDNGDEAEGAEEEDDGDEEDDEDDEDRESITIDIDDLAAAVAAGATIGPCPGLPPESLLNACGGCSVLGAEPGEPCGPCGRDTAACDGAESVLCDGTTFGNACGGCGVLGAEPGSACGPCGLDVVVCDGPESAICSGATCPAEQCYGGLDEDLDGAADCDDPDCARDVGCEAAAFRVPVELTYIADGEDEDRNLFGQPLLVIEGGGTARGLVHVDMTALGDRPIERAIADFAFPPVLRFDVTELVASGLPPPSSEPPRLGFVLALESGAARIALRSREGLPAPRLVVDCRTEAIRILVPADGQAVQEGPVEVVVETGVVVEHVFVNLGPVVPIGLGRYRARLTAPRTGEFAIEAFAQLPGLGEASDLVRVNVFDALVPFDLVIDEVAPVATGPPAPPAATVHVAGHATVPLASVDVNGVGLDLGGATAYAVDVEVPVGVAAVFVEAAATDGRRRLVSAEVTTPGFVPPELPDSGVHEPPGAGGPWEPDADYLASLPAHDPLQFDPSGEVAAGLSYSIDLSGYVASYYEYAAARMGDPESCLAYLEAIAPLSVSLTEPGLSAIGRAALLLQIKTLRLALCP